MKDLINNLLNIGITAGLSDREAFVKNVSGLIQKYQENPQSSERLARLITSYLEQMNANMNTSSVIKRAISEADLKNNEGVSELTKAIQELTQELRTFKEKK